MQIIIPNQLLEEVIRDVVDIYLIPHFMESGKNATGEWVRSLYVEAKNNQAIIYGKDYTLFIEDGRDRGKEPPLEPLINWVEAKLGIYGKEAISVAWAVKTKIAQDGTQTFRNGGFDLLGVLKSKEVNEYISARLKDYVASEFKQFLYSYVKKRLITK